MFRAYETAVFQCKLAYRKACLTMGYVPLSEYGQKYTELGNLINMVKSKDTFCFGDKVSD